MKVLFGLNNDDTVKAIVKYYEETYREKIEYKNVYYFKQAIQEINTGEYERLVILEDLEKYPTNNYAQIDDFIFKNIDAMTDDFDSKNIIFVASDRRKLGDEFLTKLFNLGVYSVLTGSNRTKSKVSQLINEPKKKKDIKKYYEQNAGKNAYSKVEVSELEIQRILTYYRNQNGNQDKYCEIFDKVAIQYTDEQLLIIIGFFPKEIRDYLNENSEKYKEVLKAGEVVMPTPTEQNTVVEATGDGTYGVEKHTNIVDKIVTKAPEVVEKIIVKQAPMQATVLTQVLEKEVIKSVYEVPKDYKKVVCIIGAPKTGTTFCINAIATMLYKKKIPVGIVDMTKKRDSYTLYTYDNEGKRAIAAESLRYASNGMNEPLVYGKLSVYTGVPGEDRKQYQAATVIETVSANNSVTLIDCDFSTPAEYYRLASEIYIVQDMDVLNVNQITMFLRELKTRGIPMSKIKVIINKHVKCALTAKDILDGIATYSSPDLKMFDELFPASEMQYFILPFDQDNYTKYIEMMFKYSNTFSSFTKDFRSSLAQIVHSIYPVVMSSEIDEGKKDNTYKKPVSKGLGFFKKSKIVEMKSDNAGFEKVVDEQPQGANAQNTEENEGE